MMRVREMPPGDRPGARLREHGAPALSTVELLALVIGGPDALRRAQSVYEAHDGQLRRMRRNAVETPARSTRDGMAVAAALELGARLQREQRNPDEAMRAPRDVVEFYAPRLEDLGHEEFHVAILDAQHRLERDVTVSRGILTSSLVHPREVFREAIAARAAAVILVHNHPSGDPAPSADDRAVTTQLVASGRLLDIPVHDHVIIGRGRYTSFAEAGLL